MLKVTNLRYGYRKNPVGTGEKVPEISWQAESDERCVIQKCYRIQVSRQDPCFKEPVWDTDMVLSDRSLNVRYEGPPLDSATRYYYRVRITDNKYNDSGWSDTAFWETGLLFPGDWAAKWICADQAGEECPLFRKEFYLKGKISSARIYATALGLYELHINGSKAGDICFAPGWTNYKKRVQYQTYDVTEMLREGANTMGAILGRGWYSGDIGWEGGNMASTGERAFFAQLCVVYESGDAETIITDTEWKTSTGPILMSEIYHGETYDARLEKDNWDMPGYDDYSWEHARYHEYSGGALIAQENEPVRITAVISPVRVISTPKGETVLDFGQNMVGRVRFSAKGFTGRTLTLTHAEVLDNEGNFYTENLRRAKQTITYIFKGNAAETYHPHFTFQGFRYVKVENFQGDLLPDDFKGEVLHSDLETTGFFRCSNDLVNRLQSNIVWSQKGNFLDVPTDCPQRDERLGWTGDAQMFIGTACFNMNIASFFRKWLRDLHSEQSPEKGVPEVIPNALRWRGASSAAWGDAATICPWTIYNCYGNEKILEDQYESMKMWVEYIRKQGENEYLWNTGFHFGDWLGLDSKPESYIGATSFDFIATAFYAYSTQILAKTACILGKTTDEKEYSLLYSNILKNFRNEFVSVNGRLVSPTQTAHVLALMFGLVEEKHRKRTADTLAKMIEDKKDHLETGFVGTPYLCFALSDNGHAGLAYRLLLQTGYPSWLYPVTKGATTIWEHWDGIKEDGSFWSSKMNSFNHYAYGSIGNWLYRVVSGINESKPGYKEIMLKPVPGDGIDFAEAAFESPYGRIFSAWKKTGSAMRVEVSIPANTSAVVRLPYAINCELPEEAEDCSYSEEGISMKLGSGNYVFEYCV